MPYIVRQCVEEVEKRGIEEVGIYRISGVATDIQALKAVFDASESGRPSWCGVPKQNGRRVHWTRRPSPWRALDLMAGQPWPVTCTQSTMAQGRLFLSPCGKPASCIFSCNLSPPQPHIHCYR